MRRRTSYSFAGIAIGKHMLVKFLRRDFTAS